MAYKQNAGRGKSNSYASMISKGLINGDGGDEKSRVVAEGPLTEKNIVEGSKAPKGTGAGYNVKGEVIASVAPKPGGKEKLNIGINPGTPKPKTKVKSVESVPYGTNYTNRQLKAKMKQYGEKWKGRSKSLATLGSIEKADDEKSSQDQITKTRTIEDAFKFTK